MLDFLVAQGDYALFLYGLALAVVGLTCTRLSRIDADSTLRWRWLATFAIAGALREWIQGVEILVGASEFLDRLSLGLLILSSVGLFESGRTLIPGLRGKRAAAWLYGSLLGATLLGGMHGEGVCEALARYLIGVPGGLLSAYAWWQASRRENGRRRTLAAASVVMLLYTITTALGAPRAGVYSDWLSGSLGILILAIRGSLAILFAGALWIYRASVAQASPRDFVDRHLRSTHLRVAIALGMILLAGWIAADWAGTSAQGEVLDLEHSVALHRLAPIVATLMAVILLLLFSEIRERDLRTLAQEREVARVLQAASATAEAASRAKSEFLANMSHEIRTPLTAILGYADVLADRAKDHETIESARIIRGNARHLLDLIKDLLDLSMIETESQSIEPVACSPTEIAAAVIATLRASANWKGVSLTLETRGTIPESIQTDPTRLRQILTNLVDNAIKFTVVGGVRIVLRLDTTVATETKLTFDVIDTGIGMSQNRVSAIFQPGSQSTTSSGRSGGLGMGLAISKRLARMLGGDIAASSWLGKGSTFSLSVPIGPLESVMPVRQASDSAEPRGCAASAQPRLHGRVLLAEDCADNQRLIAFVLQRAGAEVVVAETGEMACELAIMAEQVGNPWDVILMDMQMPLMDGYEATRRLRSGGYRRPIIALTACATTEDRENCIAAGCDDFLSKPFDPKRLVEFLRDWLRRDRPSAAATHVVGP